MAIYKVLFEKLNTILILLTICLFFSRLLMDRLPEIFLSYSAMRAIDTVVPYSKKIRKIHKSRDTPVEFCRHENFIQQKSANFAIPGNTDIDRT